ncbi:MULTISPECIES: universal stress protein [Micromonospora]|uniref:Universal stress protein n=1 Tax=Micromonospora solifontis TaxID=2487138 RepID=A0ABX9WAM3_9ACTN|nr:MULTISPECIES: universal stress protein [Micromonospora]NES12814.1 universal stress protein [Micromonospora sp. PPF5-17B]NES38920.1 universal stress protein [Micromonospora solifontis]NES54739.1 universal stress protein [Micromonospora sp. PPF5-6]RNL92581.1 universal stress protein [Micromonospora solifontis]
MSADARAPVVVGVDGSPEATRALRQAVRAAVWRRLPLRVVHAFIWPLFNVPLDQPKFGPPESGLRNQAERLARDAAEQARAEAPGIEVTAVVVDGAPAPVLAGEAETATMVVIGNRGLGGFSGLLLGSVALQVTPHAASPVLVVRGEPDQGGPVVVGMDGSPHSAIAVGLAFEEAHLRRTTLRAIHAGGELGRSAARLLTDSLTQWADRYPEVPVEQLQSTDQPAAALVHAARDAQLVVVGARGRGGFTGLLLGSVSQAVLYHAPCPVAIVRDAVGSPPDR